MSDEIEPDDLDARLLAQMLQDFLEESHEHLDQLDLNLTKLEISPEDTAIINEIFRVVHTLKGTASFVGLDTIREVAHKMEDVFGAIRKGTLKVTASIIDVMFEGLEVLKTLRDAAQFGVAAVCDVTGIVAKLAAISSRAAEADKYSNEAFVVLTTREDVTASDSESSSPPDAIDSGGIPAPSRGDDGDASSSFPTPTQPVCSPDTLRDAAAAGDQPQHLALRSETIRVSTERLDNLMNLVGELITNRNRLNEFSDRFKNDDLTAVSAAIHRLTSQIHSGLMSTRMIPIERLFNKFPGVVRSLARDMSREVELTIEGQETELDKTIIEQIHDPLVHLLRNAVCHGIENPDIRRKRGKSPAGRLRLSSWHQQNNVMIEVADDGAGIDPASIRETAVRKGLVSKDEALSMNDEQAVQLVFSPGFSTAAAVTDISGRGVGLDVVKEHVQKLRGMVDIRSAPGEGTVFRIQMPLTLAILQVLLVGVSGLSYALPLSSVSETLLMDSSEIKTMEKSEVIFIRGVAYALKRLDSFLKCGAKTLSPHPGFGSGAIPIVVVGLAEKRVALCVDELLGKQEVVMKSLGDYVGRVEGIEGASVLADGSVTLIVDVEAVL